MKNFIILLSLITSTYLSAQSNEFAFLLDNTDGKCEEITIRLNKNNSFNIIELDKFAYANVKLKMVINEKIIITEKHFLNKQKINLYIDITELKCTYSSNTDIWIRISKK